MASQTRVAGRRAAALSGLVFLWLVVARLPATAAEKFSLRLHLTPGQAFKVRLSVEQKIQPTIQGEQVTTTQTFGFGHTFRVQQVAADGTATCEVTYDSVVIQQGGGLQPKLEYDSTDTSAPVPPAARQFAGIVGQRYSIKITPTGRVIDVQGGQAIIERLNKAFGLSDEGVPKERNGNAVVKAMLEQFTAVYPDQPVAVGDSWITRTMMYMGFPMLAASRYTLEDRQGGVAVVGVASNVQTPATAAPVKMGTSSIRYDLSGKQSGKLHLDESSGWILRSEFTQRVSGTMKLEGLPRTEGPQSWPISMVSVFRVEPLE